MVDSKVRIAELNLPLVLDAATKHAGCDLATLGKIEAIDEAGTASLQSGAQLAIVAATVTDGHDTIRIVTPAGCDDKIVQAAKMVEEACNSLRILSRVGRGLSPYEFQMPQLSNSDLSLYFGTRKVQFSTVGGECLEYAPGRLVQPPNTDSEAIKASTARMDGSGALGKEYEHVYEPVPPAADIVWAKTGDAAKASASPSMPAILRKPLLKTAGGSDAEGIRSGGRTAIIWDSSSRTAYRLKGCGNYCDGSYGGKSLRFPYPGLPVAPMEKMNLATFETDEEAVEVRGCAFPHTATRELYMATRVERCLAGTGIPCALQPAAVWVYDIGDKEPLPKLKKACAVCKTLGERRLAAHAVPGIEMLVLEHLLPFRGTGGGASPASSSKAPSLE